MDFALTPTGGPCRVVRFLEAGMLLASTLSVLDAEHNVLLINKEQYDRLDEVDQHMLLRTKKLIVKAGEELAA